MGEMVLLETAIKKFEDGDYAGTVQELESLGAGTSENPRLRLYYLVSQGLSEKPAKGEGLARVWEQVLGMLKETADYGLLEEARRIMMVYANAVYCNCNDWQKLEYALLQKDVCFENKEKLLKEFQRVLLAADEEYKAVLGVVYDYARLAAEKSISEDVPPEFLEGTLKSMVMAAELQAEVGLEEVFEPIELGRQACRLQLQKEMAEAWEMRQELLNVCLHGEKALTEWETFALYAAPEKKAELETEVKKLRRREKLKSWARFGKKDA